LNHQNNYVEYLNIDDKTAKSINILATSLNVLTYFECPYINIILTVQTKLFSSLQI